MCCLISVLFATVLAKEGTFIRIHRTCLLQQTSHFMHRDYTGSLIILNWQVPQAGSHGHTTTSPLGQMQISWLLTHHVKARRSLMQKTDGRNSSKCWISMIRKYQSKSERQLVLGHKALHLRMHVWKGTVLWAWRRWNSSKQDSNQKNADGSRMMGSAGTAGAAISAPL